MAVVCMRLLEQSLQSCICLYLNISYRGTQINQLWTVIDFQAYNIVHPFISHAKLGGFAGITLHTKYKCIYSCN